MIERCEKCGDEPVDGAITTMYGFYFYADSEKGRLKPKRSAVTCSCCKQCGRIQNFKVKDLDKYSKAQIII